MNIIWVIILTLLGLLTVFSCVLYALGHKAKLIFDIYPSKSVFYEIKYCIALWLLGHLRIKLYDPSKSEKSAEELERPRVLDKEFSSYDVISFAAANKFGQTIFIYMERRRRGILKLCLYLWLPNEGLLTLSKLPDMVHFSTDGTEENHEFRGSGFHIYPEQFMRRWRIRYMGPLRKTESDELFNVKMDLVFNSKFKCFDYNRDLSTAVISDSVAREPWNLEFLNMILDVDKLVEKRMHYEQIGNLSGSVDIENYKILVLDMQGFRDHNFGIERCLSQINRYVYMALFLEDGTTLMVGNISQPSFFLSSLKVGYICTKTGEYEPITASDFELYAYGEKGSPPQHQNFTIRTAKQKYFVQLECRQTAVRYSGSNWESKIFSQFVTCRVNSIDGNGITEFLYRNDGGRPTEVAEKDPEWYKLFLADRNNAEFEDFGEFDLLKG